MSQQNIGFAGSFFFGYVTTKCGNVPSAALSRLTAERMRPASSFRVTTAPARWPSQVAHTFF